jgi:hypothetical protein
MPVQQWANVFLICIHRVFFCATKQRSILSSELLIFFWLSTYFSWLLMSVLFTAKTVGWELISVTYNILINQGSQGLWSQILFVPPGFMGKPSNAQWFHAQEASRITDRLADRLWNMQCLWWSMLYNHMR